jgi:hypothetical protein
MLSPAGAAQLKAGQDKMKEEISPIEELVKDCDRRAAEIEAAMYLP